MLKDQTPSNGRECQYSCEIIAHDISHFKHTILQQGALRCISFSRNQWRKSSPTLSHQNERRPDKSSNKSTPRKQGRYGTFVTIVRRGKDLNNNEMEIIGIDEAILI